MVVVTKTDIIYYASNIKHHQGRRFLRLSPLLYLHCLTVLPGLRPICQINTKTVLPGNSCQCSVLKAFISLRTEGWLGRLHVAKTAMNECVLASTTNILKMFWNLKQYWQIFFPLSSVQCVFMYASFLPVRCMWRLNLCQELFWIAFLPYGGRSLKSWAHRIWLDLLVSSLRGAPVSAPGGWNHRQGHQADLHWRAFWGPSASPHSFLANTFITNVSSQPRLQDS